MVSGVENGSGDALVVGRCWLLFGVMFRFALGTKTNDEWGGVRTRYVSW